MLCVDSCAGQCQNMIYLKIIMHPEHVADNCPYELMMIKSYLYGTSIPKCIHLKNGTMLT